MSIKMMFVSLLVLLVTPMSACGLSGGPFEGRVYDEESGEPIAGAYVAVTWTGERGILVDSQSSCVHTEIAVTDIDGRFHVGRWVNTEGAGVIMDRHVSALAYIAGYRMADSYFPNELAMVPFVGSNSERLKYLASFVNRCIGNVDANDNNSFNRAVYAEAETLSSTDEDRKLLEWMLYKVEIGELGLEEAERRHWSRGK